MSQLKKQRKNIMKCLEERINPSIYNIEYNMDEIDKKILEFLKQKYNWIDENIYELVMDRLEKEHHYLQRIAITKIFEDDELPDECNICGEKETDNDNFLVFCDGCNIAVHQSCYGVHNIPEGSWLCRPCFLSPKKVVSCVLCPVSGGAYKKTSNGLWCHVICGSLVPGARFENVSLVEPIDIEDVYQVQQQCMYCGSKKGSIVLCAYYGCRRAYHATCAVNSKKYIDLANCIIFCHDHDPQKKAKNILTRSPDGNYPLLENIPSIRIPIPLWIPQRRIYSEIENVSVKISDYVVNRILLRDLNLNKKNNRSAYIKEMYAVWQIRKKDRSIIKRLRIDSISDEFKNWGSKSEKEIENFKLQSNCINQVKSEFELPSEIILPKKEIDLYKIAIMGTYTLKNVLFQIEKHKDTINQRILKLKSDKDQLFSKFIPEYRNIELLFANLQITDRHKVFKDMVTDDIAPGYSSIIDNPISFNKIQSNINRLAYRSFDQMVKDVEILISNAYKYNGKDSFVGIEAKRLEEVLEIWKLKRNTVVIARVLPNPYLLYRILSTDMQSESSLWDVIEIENILTNETYLIEREKIIKIENINLTILIKLFNNLNKKTGITQEQKKIQMKSIKNYYHKIKN